MRAWQPGRHLQLVWFASDDASRATVADFVIAARDGVTVLRLVHAGFGSEASWDDEYDSIRRGWAFELRSLRHYLENFRGRTRQVAFDRIPLGSDARAAWSALVGRDGLFRTAVDISAGEGTPLTLTLPCGDTTSGQLLAAGSADFAASLEVLGNGLLRLGLETFTGTPELWVWLASWTLAQRDVDALLAGWRPAILRQLVPARASER